MSAKKNTRIKSFSQKSYILVSQTALGVIGKIAFPSGGSKGKIISFTFTGDKFNRSPPVAQRLSTSNDRNVLVRLSQTAPIELMFCGV